MVSSSLFRALKSAKKTVLGRSYSAKHGDYDVVIFGGGIVGNTMASLLATDHVTSKLKVLLLENQKPHAFDKSILKDSAPDLRCYAINAFSKNVFQKIGVWDKFQRVNPFTKMEIYDMYRKGRIRFNSEEKIYCDYDALGYIVEDKIIMSELSEISAKLIKHISKSDKIEIGDDKNTNALDIKISEDHYNAKLIIGADGKNSFIRQSLNFPFEHFEYGSKALVATVKHGEHSTTCYQRFLPNGPIGFLPLHNGYSSIVWSTTSEEATELQKMAEDDFVRKLNESFRAPAAELCSGENGAGFPHGAVGDIFAAAKVLFPAPTEGDGVPPLVTGLASARATFALSTGHIKQYWKNRAVLIGDSAHSTHPMAGQGLNMGIKDAKTLFDCIKKALTNGEDFGGDHALCSFAKEAMRSNNEKLYGVHFLKRVFGINEPLFGLMRQFGMSGINNVLWLKKKMVDMANGKNVMQ